MAKEQKRGRGRRSKRVARTDIRSPFVGPDAPTHDENGRPLVVLHQYYPPPRSDIYRCLITGKTFSERRGTPFFNARLPKDKLEKLIGFVKEGKSIRSSSRTLDISRDTVRRYKRIYEGMENPEEFDADNLP